MFTIWKENRSGWVSAEISSAGTLPLIFSYDKPRFGYIRGAMAVDLCSNKNKVYENHHHRFTGTHL